MGTWLGLGHLHWIRHHMTPCIWDWHGKPWTWGLVVSYDNFCYSCQHCLSVLYGPGSTTTVLYIHPRRWSYNPDPYISSIRVLLPWDVTHSLMDGWFQAYIMKVSSYDIKWPIPINFVWLSFGNLGHWIEVFLVSWWTFSLINWSVHRDVYKTLAYKEFPSPISWIHESMSSVLPYGPMYRYPDRYFVVDQLSPGSIDMSPLFITHPTALPRRRVRPIIKAWSWMVHLISGL